MASSPLEWRRHFPFLESGAVYFDTAATAQKPRQVIDAISHFYAHEYATVHRGVYPSAEAATARYNGVREQVGNFFGATGYTVVFNRGVTDGINLIAASFCESFLKEGDEILLTPAEHHSNLVPWQMAAKRLGLKLTFFELDTNGEIVDFAAAVTHRTRLIALPHISNTTGALHPVDKICAYAREKGIYTLIDGAQSAAHMPIDLSQIGPDFFVASGHKLYGPTGVGFLMGRSELMEKMSPIQGGGDMIASVTLEKATYATAPERFEAGTPPIAQVIGLGAALDFLNTIGMDLIESHESDLLQHLKQKLDEIKGVRLTARPSQVSGLVTFVVEGIHALDIATLLGARGVCVRSGHLCAQTALESVHGEPHVVRASVGLYTTEEEIEALAEALSSIVEAINPTAS